ncbi:MAG: aldo/keto reductase [Clostridia bacterium]|nr:aldo/keto reductase [Clostridia bacterium]
MYQPSETRYDHMLYNRCGKSGLMLSAMSLGMWHNFGSDANYSNMLSMVTTAFDLGITHFDLANNYGPKPGAAEENVGRILHNELSAHRDELIISTKAGYGMWPGPYGDHGSRKYLIASLDQSLKRLGLDYVDIFYHHRPDSDTPMEETAGALDQIVRSGKALYVGVSNYNPEQTSQMAKLLRSLGTPLTVHQPRYNMLERAFFERLEPVLTEEGIGSVCFCPLAQGLLTGRYLNGIPADSRAASASPFLSESRITEGLLSKLRKLQDLAAQRGQTLAQMATVWDLRNSLTSVILGASRASQIVENVQALAHKDFSADELNEIDRILSSEE